MPDNENPIKRIRLDGPASGSDARNHDNNDDNLSDNDNIELINEILSSGVDIDAPGEKNQTALHLAVYNKNLPIIECLLEYGASAFVSNKSDDQSVHWETPLHTAVREDRLDIVKLLLTTQVDVDKLMKNYYTVLEFANQHRNYKLRNCLLRSSSHVESKNLINRMPSTSSVETLRKTDDKENSM
ncbi:uncharacterized protein LOC130670555 [Microplitis mediator]|uniref:uncharacterized protein LOC130670555 n=1 Tax=Microplitis mediator TaxID=375433 RepID=UPI0025561278|nr:uncharacterized protein LOC130670555 [Microplitis mediator]